MTVERRTVGDQSVQRALDSIRDAVNRTSKEAGALRDAVDGLSKGSIADGKLLDGVVLEDGVIKKLSHQLGRRLTGWVIVDFVSADTATMTTGRVERVTVDGTETADETKDLWLLATGHTTDMTAKVWVF